MALCGAIGAQDSVAAADSSLVLRVLNRLMDYWTNVKGMCFETFFDTFTATAGVQSYSTSLLANGRPVEVDEMRAQLNNVDYPIEIITDQQWSDIPFKLVQALPRKCWIDTGFPNSTFYLYTIPEQTYTVYVGERRPLTNTIALATTLSFPPGYEKAIVDTLAVEIAPYFDRPVKPEMMQRAVAARQMLRTVNYVPGLSKIDFGPAPTYSYADFLRGV